MIAQLLCYRHWPGCWDVKTNKTVSALKWFRVSRGGEDSDSIQQFQFSVMNARSGSCLPVSVQLHWRKPQLTTDGWSNFILVFTTHTTFNFSFPSNFSFRMLTYSWNLKENCITGKSTYLTKAELWVSIIHSPTLMGRVFWAGCCIKLSPYFRCIINHFF